MKFIMQNYILRTSSGQDKKVLLHVKLSRLDKKLGLIFKISGFDIKIKIFFQNRKTNTK